MENFKPGLIAGLAATIVLSVLMIMKSAIGLMPELDVIGMLANMMGGSPIMGWIAHFVIGTVVWGGLFAVLYAKIPGETSVMKGIVFGIAGWLAMMIFVMPIAGAGFFGLSLGIMAPIMTLVLHIVFGFVLGSVYDRSVSTQV